MNIFAITKTPDFFIAKFNIFESQKIYSFELFIYLGLILNSNFQNYRTILRLEHYIVLFIVCNPYISLFQKFLSILIFSHTTSNSVKLIYRGVKHGIFLNLLPAIYQLTTGTSIGLYKLGESNLNLLKSQIAKLKIFEQNHLRAYGLTAHPNILAFISIINPTVNKHIKNFINLITFSGSNTLSYYLKDITKKKWINLSLFILILILTLKGIESLHQRLNQIQSLKSHQNYQPLHNILLDAFYSKNFLFLYSLIYLSIKKFQKIYFLLPIFFLDHFIISSFACLFIFLIYIKE